MDKILMGALLLLIFATAVILGYNIHLARELTAKAHNQAKETIIDQVDYTEDYNTMPGFVPFEISDPGHQPRYRGYLNGQLCYVYEFYNPDGSFSGYYDYVVDTDSDGVPDTEYYSTTPPV